MTIQDIAALRLHNQFITGSKEKPLNVVRHMGAMQAQDYNGALWSIGLRSGRSQQEIIKSIENGEILRTWPQRGTLHFVPAADAKWQVSVSAERLLKGATRRREQLGLDDKTLAKSRAILTQAMTDSQLLGRPKVMTLLEQAGISTKSGRGYHILWYLSQTGVTFVGPMAGKQQTFGLLDEWVPKPNKLSREAGLAKLAKRYFTSHGPATIQDFMWWSGLTSANAKTGLEAN